MIVLSVEHINCTSPYHVKAIDELSVSFVTDYGVSYDVGFYADNVFFLEEAYHLYINNDNHLPSPNDPKVLNTIIAIIEEFFRQEPLVMLYICDPRDHRQAARNRLYLHWFKSYINSSDFRLYSESVVYKSVDYYAGLIMRKDNPYYDEVVATFHDIVQDLPAQVIGDKTI